MPVRDEDLARALRDAAPEIDPRGAFDRVTAKRARRRTVRAMRTGVLALVAVAVVGGGVVLLGGDSERTRVDTPVAPAPVPGAENVTLEPDPGWYLRGPLVVSDGTVSVAAYDRGADATPFAFPPSRIVRFDAETLGVIDRVDLKAEILSIASGDDGVRWAVTRNPDPEGPLLPGTFLKRIAADNTVRSTDLPPGTEIAGDVAVIAGSVWVPVRDGVLQLDLNGRLVGRIDLAPTVRRAVAQLNGQAVVTNDGSLVPITPPATPCCASAPGKPVVAAASSDGDVLVVHDRDDDAPFFGRVGDGATLDIAYRLPGSFAPGVAARGERPLLGPGGDRRPTDRRPLDPDGDA